MIITTIAMLMPLYVAVTAAPLFVRAIQYAPLAGQTIGAGGQGSLSVLSSGLPVPMPSQQGNGV